MALSSIRSGQFESDEQLAVQAQRGCNHSFESLLRRFQVPLLNFLLQRSPCRADAEDLLQETFLRAHRNLGSYDSRWKFNTWLYTIARRLAANRWRDRRPASDQGLAELVDPSPSAAGVLAAEDERQALWKQIAGVLSEPQFSALWMFYVEEMTVAEIAKVLSASRVAVRVTLFRSRQQLKPHLAEWLNLEELPQPSKSQFGFAENS